MENIHQKQQGLNPRAQEFRPSHLSSLQVPEGSEWYSAIPEVPFCVDVSQWYPIAEVPFCVDGGEWYPHPIPAPVGGSNPSWWVSTSDDRKFEASTSDDRKFEACGPIKQDPHLCIKEDPILQWRDFRTTLMIRNIPNKYRLPLLLEKLDNHCSHWNENSGEHLSSYDFVYIPMDFNNNRNKGYAFINLTSPHAALRLYKDFHLKKWENSNSKKICEVTYAKLQGLKALRECFKNTRFPADEYKPMVFSPPRDGLQHFTAPTPIHQEDDEDSPEDDEDRPEDDEDYHGDDEDEKDGADTNDDDDGKDIDDDGRDEEDEDDNERREEEEDETERSEEEEDDTERVEEDEDERAEEEDNDEEENGDDDDDDDDDRDGCVGGILSRFTSFFV